MPAAKIPEGHDQANDASRNRFHRVIPIDVKGWTFDCVTVAELQSLFIELADRSKAGRFTATAAREVR